MTFSSEWKSLCLQLLLTQKEELRKFLGFKRLGWDAMRTRIMEDYDKYQDGELVEKSNLLAYQTLQTWESEGTISDTKFRFVEDYIGRLAEAGDETAAALVRKHQFMRHAETLAELYLSRRLNDVSSYIPLALPWTIYGSLGMRRSFGFFMRATDSHLGIAKIVMGFLPVDLPELTAAHFADVTFAEGFLVPVESKLHPEISTIRHTSATVKIVRQEYRGLAQNGYGDGEIHLKLRNSDEAEAEWSSADLGSPNSLVDVNAPFISAIYGDKGPDESLIYSTYTGIISVLMTRISKYDNIIDELLDNNFKGYVY